MNDTLSALREAAKRDTSVLPVLWDYLEERGDSSVAGHRIAADRDATISPSCGAVYTATFNGRNRVWLNGEDVSRSAIRWKPGIDGWVLERVQDPYLWPEIFGDEPQLLRQQLRFGSVQCVVALRTIPASFSRNFAWSRFRGIIDPVADGGASALPPMTGDGPSTTALRGTYILAGDYYIVATAGTIGETSVTSNQLFVANMDAPTLDSHWTLIGLD